MSARTATNKELSGFYPMDSLRPEHLEQLAEYTEVRQFPLEHVLFTTGDEDALTFYVLDGKVRGEYADGRRRDYEGGSLSSRYAIGDLQPRKFTAFVDSQGATLVSVDRRFLERVLAWDQLTRDENFRNDDDSIDNNRWAFRLLQNKALHKMPTGNIERMFKRFEPVRAHAGQELVREGEDADYFYVVTEGECLVSKRQPDGSEQTLASLRPGDMFGEDAMLTNARRNASVTMASDGRLMRLSARDFAEVMKPPSVDWLTPGMASILVRQGAQVLDVRLPNEFDERAIKGAINIPLFALRQEAVQRLDTSRKVIVYCNTGERSGAAAFLLRRVGFEVYALQGGISGMLKQMDKQNPAPPG